VRWRGGWGVPFKHVVADAGYGEIPTFLAGLEARRLPYVVGVPRDFGVRLPDDVQAAATALAPPYAGKGRPRQPRPAPLWAAETLLACLPEEAWETVTWRAGTKAPLTKQFVAVRVHRATGSPESGRSATHHRTTTGPAGWLLGERPVPGQTGERKWYFCGLPDLPLDAPLARLVTLAHARWPIEQFYEDAKGECGLDDYQGRRWEGLHRHLALVMLTYCFLVTQRLRSRAFPPLPATPRPAPAGLSPLGNHATRVAATPPADLPGHASPGAPLAVRGPAALDRGHRSPAPLAHPSLSPPAPLLTK
jgi:SRSO17 transposase